MAREPRFVVPTGTVRQVPRPRPVGVARDAGELLGGVHLRAGGAAVRAALRVRLADVGPRAGPREGPLLGHARRVVARGGDGVGGPRGRLGGRPGGRGGGRAPAGEPRPGRQARRGRRRRGFKRRAPRAAARARRVGGRVGGLVRGPRVRAVRAARVAAAPRDRRRVRRERGPGAAAAPRVPTTGSGSRLALRSRAAELRAPRHDAALRGHTTSGALRGEVQAARLGAAAVRGDLPALARAVSRQADGARRLPALHGHGLRTRFGRAHQARVAAGEGRRVFRGGVSHRRTHRVLALLRAEHDEIRAVGLVEGRDVRHRPNRLRRRAAPDPVPELRAPEGVAAQDQALLGPRADPDAVPDAPPRLRGGPRGPRTRRRDVRRARVTAAAAAPRVGRRVSLADLGRRGRRPASAEPAARRESRPSVPIHAVAPERRAPPGGRVRRGRRADGRGRRRPPDY
mmetsp:Transcript_3988/g.12439  ORF Transcript_3988/g.12439 Transcript_3988/m.12439 type:complete len:457 (+) Transcript_3988:726-2096(+)